MTVIVGSPWDTLVILTTYHQHIFFDGFINLTEDEESFSDGSGRESARWWIADSVSVDWSEELREPSTAPTASGGAGPAVAAAQRRSGLRVWDIERSHALRHTEGAQRRGETGELTERPEEAQRG